MTLRLYSVAPNFTARTTQGVLDFHQWMGESWAILFSHPKDFTPVCTTELGQLAKLEPEFARRNTKLIGLSVDPLEKHHRWLRDIVATQGASVKFPLIADPDLTIARLYNMVPESWEQHTTMTITATVRSVFIIGPHKRIKLMMTYPMATGRSFDEILRALDSVQLTSAHKVATPANWHNGDRVLIAQSVTDEEAKKLFPDGWDAPVPYLRFIKQPDGDT